MEISSNFSGIFAFTYLLAEACFKAIATGVFILEHQSNWKIIVFGFYTCAAFLASELLRVFVLPLNDDSIPDDPDAEISDGVSVIYSQMSLLKRDITGERLSLPALPVITSQCINQTEIPFLFRRCLLCVYE